MPIYTGYPATVQGLTHGSQYVNNQIPQKPVQQPNPTMVQGLTYGSQYLNNQIPQKPFQQLNAAALTEVQTKDAPKTATTQTTTILQPSPQINAASMGMTNQGEAPAGATMGQEQTLIPNQLQGFTNPMVDTPTIAAYDMGHGWQPCVDEIGQNGYNQNPHGDYVYGDPYFH